MSDTIVDHIRALREENKKLREENKKLKEELSRLKEDKAENEATYQRVIDSYKTKLNALYGKKQFSDFEAETYSGIIDNLK